MMEPAPTQDAGRYTVAQYLDLVRQGVLHADDRVELLEGVIVVMSPKDPWHDTAVHCVADSLRAAIGTRAAVRSQATLLLERSAPEPDVAVVAGAITDYTREHPRGAMLVVECADSSLPQDRLSKSRMYAAAGIVEYWIVSRRDDAVEVYREPHRDTATYDVRRLSHRGERIGVVALDGVAVRFDDLLPPRD